MLHTLGGASAPSSASSSSSSIWASFHPSVKQLATGQSQNTAPLRAGQSSRVSQLNIGSAHKGSSILEENLQLKHEKAQLLKLVRQGVEEAERGAEIERKQFGLIKSELESQILSSDGAILDLQRRCSDLEAAVRSAETENHDLRKKLAVNSSTTSQLQQTSSFSEEQIRVHHREKEALQVNIRNLERREERVKAENGVLVQTISGLQSELAALRTKLTESQTRCKSLEQENAQQVVELSKNQEFQARHKIMIQKWNAASRKLGTLTTHLKKREREVQSLTASISDAEKISADAVAEVQNAITEIEDLKKQKTDLATHFETKFAQSKQTMEDLQRQLKTQIQQKQEMQLKLIKQSAPMRAPTQDAAVQVRLLSGSGTAGAFTEPSTPRTLVQNAEPLTSSAPFVPKADVGHSDQQRLPPPSEPDRQHKSFSTTRNGDDAQAPAVYCDENLELSSQKQQTTVNMHERNGTVATRNNRETDNVTDDIVAVGRKNAAMRVRRKLQQEKEERAKESQSELDVFKQRRQAERRRDAEFRRKLMRNKGSKGGRQRSKPQQRSQGHPQGHPQAPPMPPAPNQQQRYATLHKPPREEPVKRGLQMRDRNVNTVNQNNVVMQCVQSTVRGVSSDVRQEHQGGHYENHNKLEPPPHVLRPSRNSPAGNQNMGEEQTTQHASDDNDIATHTAASKSRVEYLMKRREELIQMQQRLRSQSKSHAQTTH
eukprot:INCI19710.3.p1 GENE.INCI19710.3~~INCI19710.3.p1  ORF type:complete len:716 (+),score=169.84 INCI19710.3:146-2293(+)